MPKKQKISHLGVIMDGNRRWAKNRALPSLEGHRQGYNKMKDLTKWCIKRNIKIVTIYAFSSENWNRSKEEVNYLMNLFRDAFRSDFEEVHQQGVKVRIIGQKHRLAKDMQEMIKEIEYKTRNNKKLLFNVGISYGGRPEIVEACQRLIKDKVKPEKITEKLFSKYLWTQGIADPDVILRTSGEHRLSNFLTWQSAYSELIFIKKHWPAFNEKDLDGVIKEFERRNRRFGGN